jgi:hypothetical protein
MKFIHLIPVLAAAGVFGALRPSIDPAAVLGSAPAYAEERTAVRPAAEPPWLTQAWSEAPEELVNDPHDGVCSGRAVLAEDGSDPHAELCAGAEPGSAAHANDDADPHAGLYANDNADPHAGLHYGDDVDPHATEVTYEAARIDPPKGPVEPSNAPNGKRVANVFAERASLDQKTIRVRGVVVKLMDGILGKTYLHLQDGSGSAGAGDNDLTVTTTEVFSLGETVEVEGLLTIDQDIGAGYSYSALLTGATRASR